MAVDSLILPALVEPSSFTSQDGSIVLEFDVLEEFKADRTSEVTENPVETGFVISDHIINNQLKLNLTVMFTPTPVTWADRRNGVAPTRLEDIERTVEQIRNNKVVGTVKTQNNIYESMVLTSAPLSRDKSGYKYTGNFEFTNVIIVSTQNAAIPEEYASAAQASAAADQQATEQSTPQSQAGATGTNAGAANTTQISADTNNADSAQTGSQETAGTSKSVLAGVYDSVFGG